MIPSLRNRHFFMLDLLLLPAAAVLSFFLRLEGFDLEPYAPALLLLVFLGVPLQLLVARRLGLYSRLWRYASIEELLRIGVAGAAGAFLDALVLFGLGMVLLGVPCPRSIPFINGLLVALALGAPRFAYRVAWHQQRRSERHARHGQRPGEQKRVLIAGAGDAGTMIAKEMRDNPDLCLEPVGFVDDDPVKRGTRIYDLPVWGARGRIPELVESLGVAEVIIAIPSAPGSVVRSIVEVCQRAGVPARTVPGLHDILSGQVRISQLREVDIEDLLRREPVRIDAGEVERLLRGRRVLVTGAGGSIGSELCRQIARCGPAQLILLGHGENSIFQIYHELKERSNVRTFERLHVVPIIADVRDRPRLEQVFRRYRPELVFHAAAHKHVPLMEDNPCEATTNNVLGTRNVLEVAQAAGVRHCILISTDKAVNPTSIMGATKRVAELLAYQAAQENGTCFSAVRFGNVLGSRGSVIHTFRQQIARGDPVTVTHPDMRRYFMTIPEAVQLVLQAAALGQGGEVFVLDMGDQVRIVDLAVDLIRLSGLRPHVNNGDPSRGEAPAGDWDVEVVFSGARPGEKLYEELFARGEQCQRTRHEKILVAANGHDPAAAGRLAARVDRLIRLAQRGDEAGVQAMLHKIVPEYHPPSLPVGAQHPAPVGAQHPAPVGAQHPTPVGAQHAAPLPADAVHD